MSQFHPFQLTRQPDIAVKPVNTTDLSEPKTLANLFPPSSLHTSPLTILNDQRASVSTGQLTNITSIQAATPTTPTTLATPAVGRVTRIPGSRKRLPITEPLPKSGPVISHRLRHGIALISLILVGLTTLLSLAPLDNGQSIARPLFTGISNWVQAEQANWQFQASMQGTTARVTQNNPAMPPMILPKSAYVTIAQQDAINAGIPPEYFVRQINQESSFNPYATSPAGAEGIAQFMPSTAAGLGIDPWNPEQALNAAAHVMAGYNSKYGGNYAMALAAYNAGSGNVQNAINNCGTANWMNCLPAETRNYIRVIMGI
jgi:hypothetical protein